MAEIPPEDLDKLYQAVAQVADAIKRLNDVRKLAHDYAKEAERFTKLAADHKAEADALVIRVRDIAAQWSHLIVPPAPPPAEPGGPPAEGEVK